MKTAGILIVLVLALNASAQPGMGNGFGRGKGMHMRAERGDSLRKHRNLHKEGLLAGLNQDQEKKISQSRMKFQKEALQLRNQLAEKKAHLKTLSVADKPDQVQIDKTIDELTALQGQLMKKRSQHIQEIRSVLTDEQRLAFDMHQKMKKGAKKGKKPGKGRFGPGLR